MNSDPESQTRAWHAVEMRPGLFRAELHDAGGSVIYATAETSWPILRRMLIRCTSIDKVQFKRFENHRGQAASSQTISFPCEIRRAWRITEGAEGLWRGELVERDKGVIEATKEAEWGRVVRLVMRSRKGLPVFFRGRWMRVRNGELTA